MTPSTTTPATILTSRLSPSSGLLLACFSDVRPGVVSAPGSGGVAFIGLTQLWLGWLDC